MMGAGKSEGHADLGFVLVAVLWILAALATLASIYSVYAVNTVGASHVADDRVQAEASIRAGIEMAVFGQLAVPERVRPSHGAFDLRVGRTRVAVRFQSEAARIDLNVAPADLLAGLFAAVGVDLSHATTYADRVIGWRTKADATPPPGRRNSMPKRASVIRRVRRSSTMRWSSIFCPDFPSRLSNAFCLLSQCSAVGRESMSQAPTQRSSPRCRA